MIAERSVHLHLLCPPWAQHGWKNSRTGCQSQASRSALICGGGSPCRAGKLFWSFRTSDHKTIDLEVNYFIRILCGPFRSPHHTTLGSNTFCNGAICDVCPRRVSLPAGVLVQDLDQTLNESVVRPRNIAPCSHIAGFPSFITVSENALLTSAEQTPALFVLINSTCEHRLESALLLADVDMTTFRTRGSKRRSRYRGVYFRKHDHQSCITPVSQLELSVQFRAPSEGAQCGDVWKGGGSAKNVSECESGQV